MKKLFCVLIQTCYTDNLMKQYKKFFKKKEFCDLYTLNWRHNNTEDDFYHPNITKSEGLSLLAENLYLKIYL